jgi:thioredoxin 1
MATLEELNDNSFNQAVLKSDTLVVVDFWAPWCGPCRKLAPVLEQIQSEFKDEVKFYKIDADKNMSIAREYGISSLPSVLIFKDGEAKEFMAGMMQKSAIVSNIKKYLA